MTATLVQSLPEGSQWLYEAKLDGYRALVIKHDESVRVISRNEKDLTANYPGIVRAAAKVRASSAILDGEVVALDANGRPSFQALQHRSAHPSYSIAYYAFDLLELDGRDLHAGTSPVEAHAAAGSAEGLRPPALDGTGRKRNGRGQRGESAWAGGRDRQAPRLTL